MKNLTMILITYLIAIFSFSTGFAQEMHEEHQHGMMQGYESEREATEEESLVSVEEPIEVGNKICPVSGEEIKEEEKFQVEHEGKIYNLCCKMCVKDFKKDQQKYIEKLEAMEEEIESHEGHHHKH